MNKGCFQSASSRGKYQYIGELYSAKFFDITLYSMKYWGCHFG